MRVKVTTRARVRIRKQDDWWRNERQDCPHRFKEELAAAFLRILKAPKVRPPYREMLGEPVWRILLPMTEQHLYYTVDDAAGVVWIETVWGARQGKAPKLGS